MSLGFLDRLECGIPNNPDTLGKGYTTMPTYHCNISCILFPVPLQIYMYMSGTVFHYYPLDVREGDGRMQVCLQTRVVTEYLHILVETTHTSTADTTPAIGKPGKFRGLIYYHTSTGKEKHVCILFWLLYTSTNPLYLS